VLPGVARGVGGAGRDVDPAQGTGHVSQQGDAPIFALNEFCRGKLIEGGLSAECVVVKPNFVDFDAPQPAPRAGLLFVGRLSVEKGVATLAEAVALLPDVQLRVAGDGPEAACWMAWPA